MSKSRAIETGTSDVIELDSGEFTRKYKVIAKLGEGGMARVHLAVVRGVAGVRKLVVLKSVRPELVSDRRVCEMFLAEARLAATFNHPNIVQTFEVIVSKNRPLLVMEYMDGQSISRILRQIDLPPSLPLFVLGEVLNGLDYAHNVRDIDGTELNLVHRDISPQNILVTYDGHVKLLDFGIAKIIGSTGNTETGEIKGKVRYMAPEQMVGSTKLDRRADIFSVGVMLWEAVTRQRLWSGLNDVQVIQAVVQGGGVPAPTTADPNVPPCLDAICRRALAHNCDDRYESAAAMQADLQAAIEELGLRTDHRQVGRFVTEAFTELRTSIRSIIETQLSAAKASPVSLIVSDEIDVVVTEEEAFSGDLWGLPSAVSANRSKIRGQRRRRGLFVAGGAVALGGLVSALWLGSVHGHGREEAAAMAAPAATSATLPAAPAAVEGDKEHAFVHVSFVASPPRAMLFLDDVPLGSNPFLGNRPRDGERHILRVEAPGYRSQTVAVDMGGPVERKVDLEPLVTVSPKTATRPSAGRIAASSATSSTAPAGPARSCNPPFIIDEHGIKSFKPECLK
jgi:serine/threonine protein kinase